jgi:hypothetical protein
MRTETFSSTSNFHPQSDEERELLADLDLEPDSWSLTSARVSTWERPDGQVLRATRASIRPRYSEAADGD